MPEKPPQQIFDGSFFEAILATPKLKLSPPEVEIESANEVLDSEQLQALEEIQTFDWESYNQAFFERIPESAKRSEEGRRMAEIAGTQIWMSERLPVEVVSYLLSVTQVKLLWSYLNGKDRKELLQIATRGFQRTPQIVRQPVVRSRWLHWLQKNQSEIYVLLVMWSFSEPKPPIIATIEQEPDDRALQRQLPAMFRKFGIEATLCGLSIVARPRVFRAVAELFADKDELARMMQNEANDQAHNEDLAQESAEADPEVTETDIPPIDSDSALYWKSKWEEANLAHARTSESLEQLLDQSERLTRNLARQKEEIAQLKASEAVATAQWQRKLEGAQKRLQTELDETTKSSERQSRKFRALERDKAELETENRRLKKQLRHTGLLLEEEKRKTSVPEGKAAAPKASPVESILTPSVSQSAPNRPIVVQPPTPLDEIFEWRADGRPVRLTPRALRRLIDSNDEDAVFPIMQALESLRHTDKSTYSKFLKRLSEASIYYARVLTERTTRVLVDASNVARHIPTRYGRGQLRHLLGMREELRRLNCFPILFYADASLPYFIDQPQQLREMAARGEVLMVDKGVEADEILAREARRTGAYVVTNDAKFFHKVSPDFEPPRISFRIYDGTVIVDDF